MEELFRADRVNELHRDVTPFKYTDVPQVLEVQEVPSEEVSKVPTLPTATNVLFP